MLSEGDGSTQTRRYPKTKRDSKGENSQILRESDIEIDE
jgi:hypothetical protein